VFIVIGQNMPRISQEYILPISNLDHLEDLPQPIVAHGRELKAGQVIPLHQHRRAQFVYASTGVMTVTTRFASYVVPPQRSVWMPPGVQHRIDARSDVSMRTLYIDIQKVESLPQEMCVLQVTPLLRELIVSAVAAEPDYPSGSPESRIMSVILDQIRTLPTMLLALPMPTDTRVLRITKLLIENAADKRNLDQWSKEVGASKRTLGRLFTAQTGLTFQAWRQQRRLLRAIELLAAGDSVTSIGMELGYENTSAFIAMFRRCLGTTPTRYINPESY
jgi:AraC-like DNA-binding protein